MPTKKPTKKVVKVAKVAKAGKVEYKRAKNGRVYKLVNGRPRFVSNAEAQKSGLGKKEAPKE